MSGFGTARIARKIAQSAYTTITLKDLPRTALPSDIRRIIAQNRIEGISNVVLDYHRFEPRGRAYLTLMRPDYMVPALLAFKNVSMSSIPIMAFPSPAYQEPPRSRGVEGRERAAERGVLQGNGPRAGLGASGRNVVLWGLPGKLTPEGLRSMMVAWELAESSGTPGLEILKIFKPLTKFSLYSRFVIRTQTPAEAHRIVRQLHMTHFHSDMYQDRYLVKARVIY